MVRAVRPKDVRARAGVREAGHAARRVRRVVAVVLHGVLANAAADNHAGRGARRASVLFYHVPKTGGSAVVEHVLAHARGPVRFLDVRAGSSGDAALALLKGFGGANAGNVTSFDALGSAPCGDNYFARIHDGYDTPAPLGETSRRTLASLRNECKSTTRILAFSVLRQPREALLSLYRYQLRILERLRARTHRASPTLSFAEWAANAGPDLQLRYLLEGGASLARFRPPGGNMAASTIDGSSGGNATSGDAREAVKRAGEMGVRLFCSPAAAIRALARAGFVTPSSDISRSNAAPDPADAALRLAVDALPDSALAGDRALWRLVCE